jgi:hypothetical protein
LKILNGLIARYDDAARACPRAVCRLPDGGLDARRSDGRLRENPRRIEQGGGYAGGPQRLFVIETLGGGYNLPASGLEGRLREILVSCGTTPEILTLPARERNTLALDEDDDSPYRDAASARIRAFQPDTVLTIAQSSQRERGLNVTQANYRLSLFDVASKKTVWKARIALRVGAGWQGNEALANAVVNQLADDGILRGCPPLKRADRPTAPAAAG